MLRRQANGVWHVDFQYQGARVHRSTRTTDRRLAAAFETRLRAELLQGFLQGQPKARPRMALGEAVARYRDEHLAPQARSTRALKTECWALEKLVRRVGGPEIPLESLGSREVADLKSSLLRQGLAAATVNRYLASLRAILRKADREWGVQTASPVFSLLRLNNERVRALTPDEESRLLNQVKDRNPFLWRLIRFLLGTGARLREGLELTWAQVTLDQDAAQVCFRRTKNGKDRSVPLTKSVASMLAEMRVAQKPTGLSEVFLCARSGVGLGPYKCPHTAFIDACQRAGIKDLRIHDLRHTYATRLVSAGVSLYKVSTLLGHKDPRMTARYAHLATEDLRSAVDLLA